MDATGLLLDTHVLIWLVNGDITLPLKMRRFINTAAKQGDIHLAAITCWEIAMLEKRQRIILGQPCLAWLQTVLQETGIQVLSLTPDISVESCQLPGEFHGDPADRMIIATARLHHLTIVTRDKKIVQYGKKHHVSIVAA